MALVPDWFPPSAVADVSRLLAGIKPAVRVHAGPNAPELRRWARRLGLFTSSDGDGYAAIAHRPSTARRVIDLDRKPGRHTQALGTLLGYPICCSRAAARAGDEGIDDLHRNISARRFHGHFRRTNPRGHAQGGSLVSHVPCSHRCAASLSLATRTRRC